MKNFYLKSVFILFFIFFNFHSFAADRGAAPSRAARLSRPPLPPSVDLSRVQFVVFTFERTLTKERSQWGTLELPIALLTRVQKDTRGEIEAHPEKYLKDGVLDFFNNAVQKRVGVLLVTPIPAGILASLLNRVYNDRFHTDLRIFSPANIVNDITLTALKKIAGGIDAKGIPRANVVFVDASTKDRGAARDLGFQVLDDSGLPADQTIWRDSVFITGARGLLRTDGSWAGLARQSTPDLYLDLQERGGGAGADAAAVHHLGPALTGRRGVVATAAAARAARGPLVQQRWCEAERELADERERFSGSPLGVRNTALLENLQQAESTSSIRALQIYLREKSGNEDPSLGVIYNAIHILASCYTEFLNDQNITNDGLNAILASERFFSEEDRTALLNPRLSFLMRKAVFIPAPPAPTGRGRPAPVPRGGH